MRGGAQCGLGEEIQAIFALGFYPLTGMASEPPLMMNLVVPGTLSLTLSRERERECRRPGERTVLIVRMFAFSRKRARGCRPLPSPAGGGRAGDEGRCAMRAGGGNSGNIRAWFLPANRHGKRAALDDESCHVRNPLPNPLPRAGEGMPATRRAHRFDRSHVRFLPQAGEEMPAAPFPRRRGKGWG